MSIFNKFFGPPSKDAFARLILKRLRLAGAVGEMQYDPQQFWIVKTDRTQFYLGNVYAEYCRADKDGRERILKACVATWASMGLEPPEEFEDARYDLMPMLKDRCYFEVDLPLRASGETAPVYPYEIIADSLCVSLGYDLPASVMSVTQELLDRWGVTLYEALEAAKANLRETTKCFAQLGPSLYAVTHGDAYDASRLILTDLIEQMDVQGRHVAMVPNRETLLIAGDHDDQALETMAKLAEEGVAHERYITGMAVQLDNGDWEPWLPPEDHWLFERFNRLRIQSWARDYANQKQLLDARHARTGDVFIATYSAFSHNESGRVWSYAVWSRGVRTLLPQTDLVMLVSPREDGGVDELARGRWEDVQRVVGHLMEEQPEYPPRYLVDDFPSQKELAAIGTLALDR